MKTITGREGKGRVMQWAGSPFDAVVRDVRM